MDGFTQMKEGLPWLHSSDRSAGKLRDLDFATLIPGDLGITADGRHLMVYLGNGKWIQADPFSLKVTFSDPDTDPNPWFNSIVVMQRWTVLDSGE